MQTNITSQMWPTGGKGGLSSRKILIRFRRLNIWDVWIQPVQMNFLKFQILCLKLFYETSAYHLLRIFSNLVSRCTLVVNRQSIEKVHKQQSASFCRQVDTPSWNVTCNIYNNKFITFNEEVHKYKTRIKSNIHLYQSSTSAGLRSVNEVTKPLYN